jgi:F-type H+-transporting ATPase subunit delta
VRDRRIASRYAQALVTATKARNVLADAADSYAAVVQLVAKNPALTSFLEGPQVPEDEKKELLNNLFGGRIEPVLLNFFQLLVDKNRIEYLSDIGEVFARLAEEERGFARAVVTTAIPLASDLEQALSAKLATLIGSKIILEKKINPAVIGGVSVTVGDQVIDGTVRTQLDQLRNHLLKTSLR